MSQQLQNLDLNTQLHIILLHSSLFITLYQLPSLIPSITYIILRLPLLLLPFIFPSLTFPVRQFRVSVFLNQLAFIFLDRFNKFFLSICYSTVSFLIIHFHLMFCITINIKLEENAYCSIKSEYAIAFFGFIVSFSFRIKREANIRIRFSQ